MTGKLSAELAAVLRKGREKRSLNDQTEVLKLHAILLSAPAINPKCGVVAGMVDFPGDGSRCALNVQAVDFSPLHWIALADSALEHAALRMSQMAEPPRDLIMLIQRARAELNFDEPETKQ